MWSIRWQFKIAAGIAGVLLVGTSIYNYCCLYCCAPIELRLSGGNVCPLRSAMAQHICTEVKDTSITLRYVEGTHSESICAAVDQGDLDLGLVLGGFPSGHYKNVCQVAAFGVDPLHLLVRRELVQAGSTSLDMLRGKRVSLGEHGTNGAILAESLVRFAGLKPSTPQTAGDFTAEYMREHELHLAAQATRRATPADRAAFSAMLPDAVFIVDSLPAAIADDLVACGYQLLPLPYATALHLDSRRDHDASEVRLESSRLEPTIIPAFTYGVNPAVPAADCPTFGLRLLLIANKNTSSRAITRLLRAIDGTVAQRYHFNLNSGEQLPEFPVHEGAESFAKGKKPLMVGEVLEPAGDLLSVIGAGAAGGLALWGFLRGLRAVNPDVHLRQIDRIERLVRGDEQDENAPALPCDFVDFLERRLAEVKKAAIDDYAAGRLEGDEALVSILTLVADTRHLLVQRRKQLNMISSTAKVNQRAEAA